MTVAWRRAALLAALAVFPASLWIAIRGPGSLPLASPLGVAMLALAAVFLVLRDMRPWVRVVMAGALAMEGLSLLGVIPVPAFVGVSLVTSAIALGLTYGSRRSVR